MTASVHIVRGPAGAGKTPELLRRFRDRAKAAPGSALWIGPTRRAVEEARSSLLQGIASLWGARLLTFADFFEEILRVNDPKTRPLSGAQRRLVVDEIIAHLQDSGELSHFTAVRETRGFSDSVLALIAELKREDVTASQLARAMYQSGKITRKQRQCSQIFARYEQKLRQQHWHDAEDRGRSALDLLQRGYWQPFESIGAVYVDGFTDFARLQHRTLGLLADRVDEVWISLPDEAGDDRAELFSRPRANAQHVQRLAPNATSEIREPNFTPDMPAGLTHLRQQLFRPLRRVTIAHDLSGLDILEAPGMLGETRLVARRIRQLLQDRTAPEDILVTLRDVQPYSDLVGEVFAEYDIPFEMDGTEPLTRNPAVAALLRAARLPEDDWPFADVTALLRNVYFRPGWHEVDDPQRPEQAEILLRLLGEPRGRDAYLLAVRRWAEQQQPGLEDEQAEESRRRRTHELAQACRSFLQRFFQSWDAAPAKTSVAEHIAWLRGFAEDMGFVQTASEEPRDRAAQYRLWDEAAAWSNRDGATIFDRRTFFRRLNAIAAEAGLPRTSFGPGRVRVLSANLSQQLHAPHVFVMGLGERSFPRLTAAQSLLDDTERQQLRDAGLYLSGTDNSLAAEMLLFYQVVTSARRHLTFSYPAVDERGQPLLPSSFLAAAIDCFAPGAIKTEKRQMLLTGFETDLPLSLAEYRVRLAFLCDEPTKLAKVELADDLRANLADAADLQRRRFREKSHNSYDGRLAHPNTVAQLSQAFGPDKVYSPTALEDYVACPFRFFLSHVLRLEALEEPSEQIEVTRRGQAVHRAFARLHRGLKEQGVTQPGDLADAQVQMEIQSAVEEDIRRAPSNASKELWRLEGQRLLRTASRYGAQWRKFLKPWGERGIAPQPHYFEVDFGLPGADGGPANLPLVIRVDDIEVRISGRIDRVDLAETEAGVGFWIIDYKTGRSGHYTSSDLAEFRRLQLTLYALAVEEVLLRDRQARPLGLAYWLVNEDGPKVALPARNQVLWLDESRRWRDLREHLKTWVVTLVGLVRQGMFPLEPRSKDCTATCEFGQICRITQARNVEKEWNLPLPVVEK